MSSVKIWKDGKVVFEIPDADFPVTMTMNALKLGGEAYEKDYILRVTYYRDESGQKTDKPKGLLLQ